MKKFSVILLIFTIILIPLSFADEIIYEKPNIKLLIDGEELPVKDVPVIVNSRTLIPLRELLVGLGVPNNNDAIQWDNVKKAVKVVYDNKTIKLTIGSPKAYINSKSYTLDSAPIIYQSRTYLPARFIGEALNYHIDWDSTTPAVLITSSGEYSKLEKIFTSINTAMNKVKYYNTQSIIESNGEKSAEIKEKADLVNGIIHSQKEYTQKNAYIFKYETKDKTYLCTRYGNPYNIDISEWSATKTGDKLIKSGVIEIPKEVYTSLSVIESEDIYLLHNISNNYELLTLFPELDNKLINTLRASEVKEYNIRITVDKTTNLPKTAKVQIKYTDEFNVEEQLAYTINYIEYNKKVKIDLPEGL